MLERLPAVEEDKDAVPVVGVALTRATCVFCETSTSSAPSQSADKCCCVVVAADVPGTTFLHGCKKGAKYINVALICVAVAIIAADVVAAA